MKTKKTSLRHQPCLTLILLAATGLLGACSSDTTPPDDTTDDSSSSSGSTSTQTSATSTSTQTSATSTHAGGTSSTATSSSAAPTGTSSNATSTGPSGGSGGTDTSGGSGGSGSSSDSSSTSGVSGNSSGDDSGSSATDSDSNSSTSGDTDSGGGDETLSAGCGKDPTIASNMYNNGNPISIMADGRQRRYILSVPEGYDKSKPYRLIIAWHQLDGNDKQMYEQNYYWLRQISEAASSTIFVAPNGEKNNQPCTGMGNGESGCGWPDSGGSNVALADAVVAQIEENFCIDKKRIFANGWSYGGSMSYRTACSRPLGGTADWGVRGVAVYNGAAQLSSGGCTPSKEVAFYASHGTNDNVLGYDGGVQMANTFAQVNSCSWMTPARASGNHVCTNVSGCKDGQPVEFCSFVGGHTPDPQENGQRWQPQEVWKFFSAL